MKYQANKKILYLLIKRKILAGVLRKSYVLAKDYFGDENLLGITDVNLTSGIDVPSNWNIEEDISCAFLSYDRSDITFKEKKHLKKELKTIEKNVNNRLSKLAKKWEAQKITFTF